MAAQPEIEERVKKMVTNHRWMPPGYKVYLTHICGCLQRRTNAYHRRNLATWPSSRYSFARNPRAISEFNLYHPFETETFIFLHHYS